jgi:UDP-N-acetylmuramoyl-tripeptide--D-alanyl-D-alanine ligase
MEISKLYEIFITSEGISTDTRTIKKGQIYFALKGKNFDGNRFVKDAIGKGAIAVIADDSNIQENNKIYTVKDSLHFLQKLALYHRKAMKVPIIAITGSNGKTTTKELLYNVLSQKYNVLKTEGNLNNHIGVPLTLLKIKKTHELAIIEMGANHLNDIQELCEIADPDYGLITNVGKAHLGEFGSFENIIQTKTEMYRYLAGKGTVFLNSKNEILRTNKPKNLEVILYLDERVEVVENADNYLSLSYKGQIINTQLFGSYNVENVIAAIEIGAYFKVSLEQAKSGIESYFPENMRSQVKMIQGVKFVIDSYNANLSSMKASIDSFKNFSEEKILILGDMHEMGIYADEVHKEIQNYIESDQYFDIIFIGQHFFDNRIIESASYYMELSNYLTKVDTSAFENKAVLLKGSRSMGLEKVLNSFKKV